MQSLTQKFRDKNGFSLHDEIFIDQLKATERIWFNRMRIFVPKYAAHDPEYIKRYGTHYSTGQTREERDKINKASVPVYMAPIRHIKLFSEGIPIAYPDREKAIGVYKDIQAHLKTWDQILGTSMNARSNAPDMDDFEIMHEFAQTLEQFLDYYYRTKSALTVVQRATLNRFADIDRGIHSIDSTYSHLRSGAYSLSGPRVERRDDNSYRGNNSMLEPHLQDANFDAAAESMALDSIRRIREG